MTSFEKLGVLIIDRRPGVIHIYPPGCRKRQAYYPMEDHVWERTMKKLTKLGWFVVVLPFGSRGWGCYYYVGRADVLLITPVAPAGTNRGGAEADAPPPIS